MCNTADAVVFSMLMLYGTYYHFSVVCWDNHLLSFLHMSLVAALFSHIFSFYQYFASFEINVCF